MDVLNCQIINVGGRAYRVQGSGASAYSSQQQAQHSYADEDDYEELAQVTQEEVLIDDSLITQEGNSFSSRISCDSDVFPFVIGKGGETKKRIEKDTGATLLIPRKEPSGLQRNDIIVKGSTKEIVSRGRVRTELEIDNAISRGKLLDYNFFISLPLAASTTSQKFQEFRDTVCANPNTSSMGIEPSIFMHPQHLHLTIVMLKLYSDERRHNAKQVLDGLKGQVAQLLSGQPIKLRLAGLEYMNDDPLAMHVLYLKVEDQGPGSRLDQLCKLLVQALSQAGLLQPQDDRPVKLHATVINTRYRKAAPGASDSSSSNQSSGPGSRAAGGRGQGGAHARFSDRQPFDGRQLLEEYGQLDLGVHTLQAVHLSQRGRFDDNGYYHCAHRLNLV